MWAVSSIGAGSAVYYLRNSYNQKLEKKFACLKGGLHEISYTGVTLHVNWIYLELSTVYLKYLGEFKNKIEILKKPYAFAFIVLISAKNQNLKLMKVYFEANQDYPSFSKVQKIANKSSRISIVPYHGGGRIR